MTDLLWKLDRVTLKGRVRPRLDEVSCELTAGITAVVGYSGAGKTSLLNLLTGFERSDYGKLEAARSDDESRLPLFWVPQNDGLWPHLSAVEHLKAVLPSASANHTTAVEILARFDLAELCDVRPDAMSQGERSRLSLARAIASGAAILVLDEPLAHVDPARVNRYWDVFDDHCRETSASAIIATHSAETVLRQASRAVCMKDGCVLWHGRVEDLYHRPDSEELAAFLGPANWIAASESSKWLGATSAEDRCLRPERLKIVPREDSPLTVAASRFTGAVAEVDIHDERDGAQRRFYHRPEDAPLPSGSRVALCDRSSNQPATSNNGNTTHNGDRQGPESAVPPSGFLSKARMLLWFLILTFAAGCTRQSADELDVREVSYWPVPSDGRRSPAPRGVTTGQNGELIVLDNAGRVLVYGEDGKVKRQWRMPEYAAGNPEGVCVFKDGRIVVADTHYHRIVFFDQQGKLLGTQGSLGTKVGQFKYPVTITQDDDENFYVGEYGSNDRIQKFARDGTFLKQFGEFGTGDGQFQRPAGIVWREGKIYVADAINNRIQVFTDAGQFERVLEIGDALQHPYGIALGADDDLFIVEYAAGCVTRFDLQGKLLGRFGASGRGERQFSTPWDLTVTRDGNVIVVDTGNRRVVKLQF